MNRLMIFAAACVAALAAACSPAPVKTVEAPAAPAATPAKVEIPAGAYTLDPTHSTLLVKMEHLGFSNYTARFDDWTAKLQLDPANLAATQLEVSIDPRSLGLPAPPEGFKAELLGKDWLDAGRFPTITFKSTGVQPTGPDTATVTGDLTLHGVTKPVALQAKFNGGYPGHPLDPHARAGFSAHGAFKRSAFGMGLGVPAPGGKMGVGDEVQLVIETEFNGPPLPK